MEEKFKRILEYVKIVDCCAIASNDIKNDMKTCSGHILKLSRIPGVCDLNKVYSGFRIEMEKDDLSRIDPNQKLILLTERGMMLSKRYYVFRIELILQFDYFTYDELFKVFLPENARVGAYEVVGDVIHLNLNEEQAKYKEIIGFILHNKTGKTVVNKTGKIDNVYRNYELEVLQGDDRDAMETIVLENGIKMVVDLKSVYWCSRLQGERSKLISEILQGGSNQIICDCFCGVGPHALPLAKAGCVVYANDLNSAAISCLKKSAKLNQIACTEMNESDLNTVHSSRIFISNQDASLYLSQLTDIPIDHFIFNLPEYSLEYVKHLRQFSHQFTLHAYFFVRKNENSIDLVRIKTGVSNPTVTFVRDVSPSKSVYKLTATRNDLV
ncbi:TRM5 [Enterospora canceri]|uniref:TRM5 n=1 Tax=Enterospora canceri TaxID=1081671 RepID=A0A1Y1S625_9MICR|nr:TRM5 [Enterospora canceri]